MLSDVKNYTPEQFKFYTTCLSNDEIERVCDLILNVLGNDVSKQGLPDWLETHSQDLHFEPLLENLDFLGYYNENQTIGVTQVKQLLHITEHMLQVLIEFDYLEKEYQDIISRYTEEKSQIRIFKRYQVFHVFKNWNDIQQDITQKRKQNHDNKKESILSKKGAILTGRKNLPNDMWEHFTHLYSDFNVNDLDFIMCSLLHNTDKKYSIQTMFELCSQNGDVEFYIKKYPHVQKIYIIHKKYSLFFSMWLSQDEQEWLQENLTDTKCFGGKESDILRNMDSLFTIKPYNLYKMDEDRTIKYHLSLNDIYTTTYLKNYRKYLTN